MRSADLAGRALTTAVLLGMTGCASVGSMFERVPLGGPRVETAVAAPASGTGATSAGAAPVAASSATPVPGSTATAGPARVAPPASPTSAPPAARAAGAAATAVSTPSSNLPTVYGAESDNTVTPAAQRAFDEARRLMRAGNAAEAERAFRTLAQANPGLGGPHANLGVLYRQAGKLAEAVAEGEKAVRASPKQPVFFNQLGISYRQNGQFDKAREAYQSAIELDGAYAAPHLNLGILHDLYLADLKRALELYDKYLALSPGGDAVVTKWVADLKNRKPPPAAAGPQAVNVGQTPSTPDQQVVSVSRKEIE